MINAASRRAISNVSILCDMAQEQGLTAGECLAGTGLAPEDLRESGRSIEIEQELQAIRNVLAALGEDKAWGLNIGLRYRATTFAAWGFAVLSSLTARQAVEVGLRYIRLTTAFCQPQLVDKADESMLVVDSSHLPKDLERFMVERELAAMQSLQRDVVPIEIPLTRLEFSYAEPTDIAAYEELFQITPSFGHTVNRIGVKSELGNMALPQGNHAALRYCERQCQQLLDKVLRREGVSGQLREWLLGNSRQMPRMPAAADALNTSVRSLRRRLQDEGADYETLVTEVRRSMAEELLHTGALNIDQIAERLGYAEVASFSRAFKRWTGVSPKRFRQDDGLTQ